MEKFKIPFGEGSNGATKKASLAPFVEFTSRATVDDERIDHSRAAREDSDYNNRNLAKLVARGSDTPTVSTHCGWWLQRERRYWPLVLPTEGDEASSWRGWPPDAACVSVWPVTGWSSLFAGESPIQRTCAGLGSIKECPNVLVRLSRRSIQELGQLGEKSPFSNETFGSLNSSCDEAAVSPTSFYRSFSINNYDARKMETLLSKSVSKAVEDARQEEFHKQVEEEVRAKLIVEFNSQWAEKEAKIQNNLAQEKVARLRDKKKAKSEMSKIWRFFKS
ncbi:hypothetical protein Cgig2_025560 [Carnegiea gigantea]|uniref:Uncharacterized protein n=1 Tax=Carnegiea gigantea TaxID=171969 RepID=A0A9Q1JQU5_9CARY|nr:hypothetical protein Cgig2_025560 [Carnegiea gigantea]